MLCTSDAHAGNGSTFKGAKQNAAKRVAECVAKACFNGLGDEGNVVGIIGVLNALQLAGDFKVCQLDDVLLFLYFF